jgi:uncharacterized membrane protein
VKPALFSSNPEGAGVIYTDPGVMATVESTCEECEALARVEARSAEAERSWSSYVAGWTAWNHLRFAGALAAAASLVMALVFSA